MPHFASPAPAGEVGAGCWAAIFVPGSSHVPGVRGHPCAGRRFRRRAGRDPQWSAGDGAAGGLSAWAMDAAIAPVPGAGPPEGVRWAPGRAEPASATRGALASLGARSCARREKDAVWLQRELGSRRGRGRAEVSGPLLLALDPSSRTAGSREREGCLLCFAPL